TSLLAIVVLATGAASAADNHLEYKKQRWDFDGVFGKYDKDALQRGYQVYETVCSNCHGVDHLYFRNLGQKGGPFYLAECPEGVAKDVDCRNPNQNPIIKAIAANYKFQVTDGPDDSGDMFKRKAMPSDHIPGPYANAAQARAANGGALPPDLSMVIKAREDGPDYVYSLLTGFEDAPDTVELTPMQHYNPYFRGDMSQFLKAQYRNPDGKPLPNVDIPPGGVLAMIPPLSDGIVDYADPATPKTVDQYARDVVEFLSWASEPSMEERKELGFMTIAYLLILAGLLYWSYRAVWANIAH
ncbi:MAG TPA: cytochrome c1, partial [Parvularculaceae bacterium]|nr:cytochrome c1 [Parvularculaceae bacterium]